MTISGAEILRDLNISSKCSVEAIKNTKLRKLHEVSTQEGSLYWALGQCRREKKVGERLGRARKPLFKYCLNPLTS